MWQRAPWPAPPGGQSIQKPAGSSGPACWFSAGGEWSAERVPASRQTSPDHLHLSSRHQLGTEDVGPGGLPGRRERQHQQDRSRVCCWLSLEPWRTSGRQLAEEAAAGLNQTSGLQRPHPCSHRGPGLLQEHGSPGMAFQRRAEELVRVRLCCSPGSLGFCSGVEAKAGCEARRQPPPPLPGSPWRWRG